MSNTSFFAEILTDAIVKLYRAREYSGLLPAIDVAPDKKKRRVVLDLDEETWKVYERLAEVLAVPPQMLLIALTTSAAIALLERRNG